MRARLLFLFLLTLVLVAAAISYSYFDTKVLDGGVVDDGGRPIANAALTIAGRSVLSDSSGQFHVSIPRGAYDLIGFSDGFASARLSVDAQDPFETAFSAKLTLPQNEFTATVTATDLRRPLAGASISIQGRELLTADARGDFTVRGIKNGTQLAISAPGYRPGTFIYSPGGTNEYSLSPALARVTVADEYSKLPLANATVTAGDQTFQTDEQGQTVLRALAPGTWITAQQLSYDPERKQYGGEADLALALRPNILQGKVVDRASGKPIPGARLFYNGQLLETDAQVGYQIKAAPSELTLKIKVPGYRLTTVEVNRQSTLDLTLPPFKAKGLHIYYGMPREQVLALLDRLVGTEVNAVALDVKEGAGEIVWPSEVPLAQQLGVSHTRGIPPKELIQFCRDHGWYCIARMVIFKDNRVGAAHPEWALHYPDGSIYNAGNEIWLNPARQEVWSYNIALAKELSALGFDEVQFDYIRYPGTPVALEMGTTEMRLATIAKFLETASNAFRALPTFFSGDVFGLTTATPDEQGIGQRLEVDARYFDYLSPMMYPSTWKGSPSLFQAALQNPTCPAALACGYGIIYHGTLLARQRGGALVRPWLQAYGDVGFGVLQYIEQKKGADDADSAGWLFWNNQGLYPDSMFEKR